MLATVTVAYIPGTMYQTRIEMGELKVIGDGLGPSPYELLLASLGHCTVLTILVYARRKEWPIAGVLIRATHDRLVVEESSGGGISRRKVERIVQEISLDGELDGEQRARLMEIAGKCPVHRTLTGELEIIEVAVATSQDEV